MGGTNKLGYLDSNVDFGSRIGNEEQTRDLTPLEFS
jgi:hypothetical protein